MAKTPRFQRVPPGPGAFTQVEYDAWMIRHPLRSNYYGGPWETDAHYARYTSKWFWSIGYFYSGSMYGGYRDARIEVWLTDKGKGGEIRVFRGPKLSPTKTSGTKAERPKRQAPASPPTTLEDPQAHYGPTIAAAEGINIMGQTGDGVLYEDGTIEIFVGDASAPITYRPLEGGVGGYEYIGQDGQKAENVIIAIDEEELFGRR